MLLAYFSLSHFFFFSFFFPYNRFLLFFHLFYFPVIFMACRRMARIVNLFVNRLLQLKIFAPTNLSFLLLFNSFSTFGKLPHHHRRHSSSCCVQKIESFVSLSLSLTYFSFFFSSFRLLQSQQK